MACPGGCIGGNSNTNNRNGSQNDFVQRGPKVNGSSINQLAGKLATPKKKKQTFFEMRRAR